MPLQMGPSTDMTTIKGDDAAGPISFVKDPDTQQFSGLFDKHQEPYFQNAYPQDINDLNLGELAGDIAKGVQDAGKAVYEAGKGVYEAGKETLQDVGVIPASPKPTKPPAPPKPAQPKPKPKPQAPRPEKQGEEGIKNIQAYFQNPTPLLQSFIGNARYTGELDGNPGPKTQSVINKLESSLANILGTNVVYGSVLRSSGREDIESALQKVAAFRRTKKADKEMSSMSRDDRMYILSKILISSK